MSIPAAKTHVLLGSGKVLSNKLHTAAGSSYMLLAVLLDAMGVGRECAHA